MQTPPPRQQRQPERYQATVPPRRQHVHSDLQETQVLRSLPLSRSQANQGPQQMNTTKATIAINNILYFTTLQGTNEVPSQIIIF